MKLNENLKVLLLFVIAFAIRLALIPLFNFCFDDAYINYRIARNLARGYGMVFNPGEHVLATTTMLYTLFMTPTYWLGIAFPLWSKIINSLAMAGSIVLLYKILSGRMREGLVWFTCLFLAFNYVAISQDLLGMEASLVIFCLLLATYLFQMQRGWLLGLVLGALFLVRPEGMFAAFLFWLATLVFKRQLFWRTSIPLAAVAVCWAILCQSFYGTLIPNTYSAKLAFFGTNPTPFKAQLNAVGRFLFSYLAFAPILILLLPLGIWRIFVHTRDLLPLTVWAIVILLMQLFSAFYLAPWYLAMVMPFIFLICVVGLEQLFARVLPGVGRFFKLTVVILIVCLCTVLYEAMVYMMTKDAMYDLKNADNLAGEIGGWLKREKISPKQVLAIEAIGRVGYESDIRILDIYGLASPQMIPFVKTNDLSGESIIKSFQPDYLLVGDPELVNRVQGYKIAHIFTYKQRMRGKNVPMETVIFKKEE
jgi:arabinofuranosyltransferase